MTKHTPLHKATPQQRRVLRMLRETASLKETADRLEISYQTAKNHMRRLRKRTESRSDADLFYWLGAEEPPSQAHP